MRKGIVPCTAAPGNSRMIRIGATTFCSTNTSMATTAPAWAQAIKQGGLGLLPPWWTSWPVRTRRRRWNSAKRASPQPWWKKQWAKGKQLSDAILLANRCSVLPNDLCSFEGHRCGRMKRDDARCVVACRSRCRDRSSIKKGIACRSLRRLHQAHFLPENCAVSSLLGVELYFHIARIEFAQGNPDFKNMLAIFLAYGDRAKPNVGPLLCNRFRPVGEFDSEKAFTLGSTTVGRGSRQIVFLQVFTHRAIGRKPRR